ncbi:MAG: DUF2252 domain-containing protein, partial [Actinomycetes bacterium]
MGDGWSTGGGRSRAAQGRAPLQPRRLGPGWPSPLRLLEETNRHRVPELVPIRAARMRASP